MLLYVVNTQRSVSSLEAQNIIPNAVYFNEVLNASSELFLRLNIFAFSSSFPPCTVYLILSKLLCPAF
jgi:hypothetical protein